MSFVFVPFAGTNFHPLAQMAAGWSVTEEDDDDCLTLCSMYSVVCLDVVIKLDLITRLYDELTPRNPDPHSSYGSRKQTESQSKHQALRVRWMPPKC